MWKTWYCEKKKSACLMFILVLSHKSIYIIYLQWRHTVVRRQRDIEQNDIVLCKVSGKRF